MARYSAINQTTDSRGKYEQLMLPVTCMVPHLLHVLSTTINGVWCE